jgi:UDP-N-acetylmuramoyl-tripeptide--D-alanyl-D-alanine ligase
MKEFSIKALAQVIKAHIEENTSNEQRASSHGSFTGVSTDSRTIKAGDCFFALTGENFDGHDYVVNAFAKGAVCAVVNEISNIKYQISKFRNPILIVNDTVKALGDFAREYRRQANYKVVAITGSAGKTTTRQIAYHVLSQYYRVYQSPKNFNNNIGLPLTLLGADPEDKIVIAELGTNHPGEIAYLTRIAQPDIAVVINVHPAHLEGLGDLQTITREKLSIAEGLQPDGVLIVNSDLIKYACGGSVASSKILTFGQSNDSDYQISNIIYKGFSSSFIINDTKIELPLPGLGNVENAVAAWAICNQFGLTVDDFAQAVKTLQTISMRTEVLHIGTLTVINDCYNANPASMKNALDILSNLNTESKGRLVFVCGDMAELGQQSQTLHAELGADIVKAGVQVLLTVGKLSKITAEAAEKAANYDIQIKCFDDTISACNNLQQLIKDYDIILVKGSRVAKLELLVEKLNELFTRSVSREAR